MIDVIRKICAADTPETFKFAATSVAFRVKNFTSGKILVCLGREWDESQSVRVNSNMAETLVMNPDPARRMTRSTSDTVIVKATIGGEVEVMRDD